MKSLRHLGLLLVAFLCGCAATFDVDLMLRDFDDYGEELCEMATEEAAISTLEAGEAKRARAGILVDEGKQKEAIPIAERALADARLALELNVMREAAQRAELCRVELERARMAWREARFVLEQTEDFVGSKVKPSTPVPKATFSSSALPISTLASESFPPATMEEVSRQWESWRQGAREQGVAAASFENVYRRSRVGALAILEFLVAQGVQEGRRVDLVIQDAN